MATYFSHNSSVKPKRDIFLSPSQFFTTPHSSFTHSSSVSHNSPVSHNSSFSYHASFSHSSPKIPQYPQRITISQKPIPWNTLWSTISWPTAMVSNQYYYYTITHNKHTLSSLQTELTTFPPLIYPVSIFFYLDY